MSPYKLRRCSICGKFHASYLVPDGKDSHLHYCTSCWKAWQAAQSVEIENSSHSDSQDDQAKEFEGTTDTNG